MNDSIGDADLAIQDRVVVEFEAGGLEIGVRAVVVKSSPTELWLGLSCPDHRIEKLEPGRKLQITAPRSDCALIGPSEFIKHLGESRSRIFSVARPGQLEKVQRRAYARLNVQLDVLFRQLDPFLGTGRGKPAVATTVNIGKGGMLFETDTPPALGDDLEMTVPLSAGDRLTGAARVTRLRILPETAAAIPAAAAVAAGRTEVAVKFTRLTSADQERLIRHCLLVEHRRRQALSQAAAQAEEVPGNATDVVAAPAPAAVSAVPPTPASGAVPAPRANPGAVTPDPRAVAAAVAAAVAVASATPRPMVAALASDRAPAATTPPTAAVATAPAPSVKATVPPPPPDLPADAPLVAVGLAHCRGRSTAEVRAWFDSQNPFDRITVLSQVQENMSGSGVPGAPEAAETRPLAQALGLIAT